VVTAAEPRSSATWLGQAGFRVDVGGVTFVIDPWGSPHELRLIPPPPPELAEEGVDWLLVTHEHIDHLDLPFLPRVLERSPRARVVLPASVAPLVADVISDDRLVTVQPGNVLDLGGVEVRVVPAFHGVTMDDAYGDGSVLGDGPRFVGYVLGSTRRVYHAGDTIVTEVLREALEPLQIEVALLPINGRDDERHRLGIVGNMDAREAVDLALAIGASTLVPYHWDGFEGNTVAPGTTADLAGARLHVTVPARFRALDLP
jgi:L-ascorbate metabolism protein UlaG (beta-lactamase superfamily)